ncbi:YopX family protein [Macrococcus animalis]|uniref:YopX family protein n=1 Tax=Macrococcus animalis TaxID=3395467 RepID=UPI0039BDF82E
MIPKLRVWNKKLKFINTVAVIDFKNKTIEYNQVFLGEVWRVPFDEVILMPSTGLTDIGENEVFAGDIVNIHWFYRGDGEECEAELNNVVIYYDSTDEFNAPYFFVMDKDEVVPLSAILMHEGSIEVLGNIHEHSELLVN